MVTSQLYRSLNGEVKTAGDLFALALRGWNQADNNSTSVAFNAKFPLEYDYFFLEYRLYHVSGKTLVTKGSSFDFVFSGMLSDLNWDSYGMNYSLQFKDGTHSDYYTADIASSHAHPASVAFSVPTVSKDVVGIYWRLYITPQDLEDNIGPTTTKPWYFIHGFGGGHQGGAPGFNIVEETKEQGFLSGIFNGISDLLSFMWELPFKIYEYFSNALTNIWNTMVAIPNMVWNSFSTAFNNLIQGVIDLPAKVWGFIENGIKVLFVPSSDYMTENSNRWDNLLSDRFGAVYQVGGLITDFWSNIEESDRTNIIKLPATTVNLSGVPFTFGGHNVKVIPDGFSGIVDILKIIINISCTFLFVNGIRKRYDKLMEG